MTKGHNDKFDSNGVVEILPILSIKSVMFFVIIYRSIIIVI